MRRHIKTLKEKYRNLRRWQQITLFLLLVVIVILVITIAKKPEPSFSDTGEDTPREVVLKSVADLSLDREPLDLIGTVQSESQVDIRTEAAGSITRLAVKLGDVVSAGQIIAEIQNSTERASVTQAGALLDAQQAQLDNLEDSFGTEGDTVAVENARRTLLSSGLVAEPWSKNSTLPPPIISGTYKGSEEGIYDFRIELGRRVDEPEIFLRGLEDIDSIVIIDNELKSTALGTQGLQVSFTEEARDYVNSRWIVEVPNTESPSYTANLNVYNTALDSQLGVSDQIIGQQAQVQSAKSTLDAAVAQLEKTIIRSPIAGKVTDLEIDLGDFVSNFQSVAVVANENRPEIKTYVTQDDKASVEVGSPVVVAGEYEGVITSIDPAVDAATKKIEISISIEKNEDLLNGQSVKVSIPRSDIEPDDLEQIFIPLSALKVTAEGVVVFSVNSLNEIEQHIVQEGPLVGDKVLILEGLTPEMKIVTDVRGIRVGDSVTILE